MRFKPVKLTSVKRAASIDYEAIFKAAKVMGKDEALPVPMEDRNSQKVAAALKSALRTRQLPFSVIERESVAYVIHKDASF